MKRRVITTALFLAVLGPLMGTHVAAEETPRLPRAFHNVHLGMGVADVNENHAGQIRAKATQAHSTVHVVDRLKDPYIKRVEYDFYNGRLAEITINYNPDRLKGKVEPFLNRLTQSYGTPQATEGPQLAVTDDVYAEKKTHWSDSQTHVTLIERTGHDDDVPHIVLVLSDVALSREKENAMKRKKEEDASKIPIPVPSVPEVRHRTATQGVPSLATHGALHTPSIFSGHSARHFG